MTTRYVISPSPGAGRTRNVMPQHSIGSVKNRSKVSNNAGYKAKEDDADVSATDTVNDMLTSNVIKMLVAQPTPTHTRAIQNKPEYPPVDLSISSGNMSKPTKQSVSVHPDTVIVCPADRIIVS